MDEYDRFFKMLNTCPRLAPLWDQENRKMKPDFEKAIAGMSSGEKAMARFYAGVWLGRNDYGFDLIAAMHTLDEANRRIILDWVIKPVFP